MVRDVTDKRPEYFEAILQLREVSEEVFEYAQSELHKNGIHIAKIVPAENGYDLYTADSDFTKSLGRRIQERFGGEYKISPMLFGRKDSRQIYRLTILVRGVPFKRGDKVLYEGEEYIILMQGKEFMLQEIKTGKKIHLKYHESKRIKLVS